MSEEPQVPSLPHGVCPLLTGTAIPPVTLTTIDGNPFDLSAAVLPKPSILVFYRGGW